MTARSFVQANAESRERLAKLVARLTPGQMEADLGEGWTVASAVAHMGFWDRWQAERWTEMLAGRWSASNESILAAEHLANDALHPYWAGIRAEEIPALALEAAEKCDALIAAAPDAMVEALEGTSVAFLLHRHRHRGEHIDHIERVLAAAGAAATSPEAGAAATSPEAGAAATSPVDRGFVDRNAASRRRLATFAERLRESELSLPTEEGGWTVAQVLAHIAFWDRSMEARWRQARDAAAAGEPFAPIGVPGEMTEAINPPLADMIGAWTDRLGTAVAAETMAAAQSLDALIEELAPGIPDAIVRDKPNFVDRTNHRTPHLDQLERALAAVRAPAPQLDRSYLDRNEASRARLREATWRLSAVQLDWKTEEQGWTVGQILGHMAFWDRFLAARWREAIAAGPKAQPGVLPHEVSDLLNAALPHSWGAFASKSPKAAIAETLAAANEVDALIAGLPAEAPVIDVLADRPALLDRSIHRYEHLAQIERAIS